LGLSGLTHNLAGTASDVTFGYAYNPAGQITSRTRSNDAYAWDGAVNVNRNDTDQQAQSDIPRISQARSNWSSER
jgi:YD repeat-containing protein